MDDLISVRLVRMVCVLTVLPGLMAVAQTSAFEGKPIVDIQFPSGQPLDPHDLERVMPLKKGQPLHSTEVGRAIDGLFGTGRFEDIIAEAEPSGDGVIVRFVTQNAWFVGGTQVEGRLIDSPNRAQVDSAGELSLGAPFEDADVQRAVGRISRLLEANGLYEAQVMPEVVRDNAGQRVLITFRVKAGKRAKYETPSITGTTKLSDSTIIHATGWRIPVIHWWRHVSSSRTRGGVQDVLKKYSGQDRLMAQVDLKKLDYDSTRRRVHPELDIDAGPKVKVTAVETKISRRVLKKYVPVFEQHAVDEDLLEIGKQNLRDYFQNKGYYDASVGFRVQPVQNDLETIEYVVSPGNRYKLVRVTIRGSHYFDTATVRERMFIQPAGFLVLRHGRYSEAFRHRDEENIANLYRANGFRDVKVTAEAGTDRNNAQDIAVTVNIDEGKQWLVDELTVNGVKLVKQADLPSLASAAGQPFSEVNIASDRESLLTYYYTQGFPHVAFNASWQPDAPEHVGVVYSITEGKREFVRDVSITGLRTTRQSLVEKAITLKPGDPLSPVAQTNIQRALYDLDIFASVDTAIQNPDGDTDYKNVLYHFDEANRYTFSLGFGAQVARFGTPSTTSLASPGGATGFSPEGSLSVSRLNFLGLGHTVTAQAAYSSLEKRGSLTYLQPRIHNVEGRNLTYSFLYDNTLNVRTFAAKREEGSVQLSQKFTKAVTGLMQFSYRRVSVGDVVIPVLLVPQFLQPVRLGILSASLIQDRRDNPANPHRGMYNTVNFGLSANFFGSQRNFGRALLRNATYYRIGKNLVLARQTQFGLIEPFKPPAGVDLQESVPLPERFFAGGADSLRAFPYNQAGPRDIGAPLVPNGPSSAPTGFPLGGNALFINNVELRFPVIGQNIQGVLFHDMGNVYSSLGNISFRVHQDNRQDFDYMVHAVGLGVRYRTPVGPVRVDFAYALNPPSYVGFSGTPAQLLNCNPNLPPSQLPGYCQSSQQNVSHFQFFFSIGQTF